jgi:hypothetical protein
MDGQRLLEAEDAEEERAWRQRIAEAARLKADDLAREDHPSLRALLANLRDLQARMTSEVADWPETSDSQTGSD